MLKNEKGVTLIALITIVIVLLIIATITIHEGTSLINKSEAESIETNMLMINGKIKGIIEEINAANWADTSVNLVEKIDASEYLNRVDLIDVTKYSIDNTDGNLYAYTIDDGKKDELGFSKIENLDKYIVTVKINNSSSTSGEVTDIIYTDSVKYKGTTYYLLSKLQDAIEKS